MTWVDVTEEEFRRYHTYTTETRTTRNQVGTLINNSVISIMHIVSNSPAFAVHSSY